ncbi:unnamed protein product, partial [Prorocentrum cordatum]
ASGFHDEVQMLSKFRHPNLVTLLGWAKDEDARYLVYELLSGGDLFQRLVRSRRAASQPFTWQERRIPWLSVCLDAATGLSHLHNSTPQAFHRDVKSANIVLSGSGTAKMADFGLSCTAGPLEAATLRAVCGTPGYLCPLYKATGRMSEGSEVYSFGMVMLEVVASAWAERAAPGGLAYPIARSIMPQQAGALERCMQGLDRGAAWPTEENKEKKQQHASGPDLACTGAQAARARIMKNLNDGNEREPTSGMDAVEEKFGLRLSSMGKRQALVPTLPTKPNKPSEFFDVLPVPQWQRKGDISCQWKQLVRVDPQQGDAPLVLSFVMANVREFNLDKQGIVAGVKAPRTGSVKAEWSL